MTANQCKQRKAKAILAKSNAANVIDWLCSLDGAAQGFVMAVTMVREAVDEMRRYQRDKEMNSQLYSKLTVRGQCSQPTCARQLAFADITITDTPGAPVNLSAGTFHTALHWIYTCNRSHSSRCNCIDFFPPSPLSFSRLYELRSIPSVERAVKIPPCGICDRGAFHTPPRVHTLNGPHEKGFVADIEAIIT